MSLPPLHTQTPARMPAPAPLHVLILEDERFDRHRLARMCSALDFPCLISNATTLSSFADTLAGDTFGLILLDYMLPDGTGLDALDMVRLCARNLNAPTLMISGAAHETVASKASISGCRGYLSKDRLTIGSFGLAVRDALGPSLQPLPLGKERFNQAEVQDLLAQMASQNARDVKPMVSRLLRQLRGLRSAGEVQDGLDLKAIEKNCLSLWAFLVEMERQDGADVLQDMISRHQVSPSQTTNCSKTSKPPSPFSRMSH